MEYKIIKSKFKLEIQCLTILCIAAGGLFDEDLEKLFLDKRFRDWKRFIQIISNLEDENHKVQFIL